MLRKIYRRFETATKLKAWRRDESLSLTLNIRSVSATDLYKYESQDKTMIAPNRLRRVVSSAAFPARRIVLVVAAAVDAVMFPTVVTVASMAATLSGVVVTSMGGVVIVRHFSVEKT
ncbi:hypothetical protein F2Q70_00026337 [Brassica cretica]|uniref:Uncharacterized protein n=1 Tax=Brassica cretica TaxID=69181 RepID=A0A8S9L536_BRACR|nr:hypothetical protein F2Q70_00026337 [Brassica cretica]